MKIGLIGLGDVGSRLASGASAEGGAEVFGFDSNVGSERMAQHEARCRENNVQIVADLAALIEKSDVILAATSATSALAVAEGAAEYLCKGKTYVDLNSAVPDIKRSIQSVVEKTGADFCDGGILGAPIADGVHVSIALSGACSEKISLQLNAHAFNTKSVGPEVGQASGLDSTMSRAAEKKLMWTTNSGAKEHFGAQDAACLDVIKYFADIKN